MVRIDEYLAEARAASHPTGRPLVTLSYAQSLDGSIASSQGQALKLSGPEAMALTHRLRAAHDAILVGIGTLLADDPQLTVRLVEGSQPQPVVLDGRLRFPLNAKLLHGPRRPWIACGMQSDPAAAAALAQAGARLFMFPLDEDGRVPLQALLQRLAEMGVHSLMVEGGAQVIAAFLKQRLADALVLTIAPLYVSGLPAVAPGSMTAGELRLTAPVYETAGDDLIVWGKLN